MICPLQTLTVNYYEELKELEKIKTNRITSSLQKMLKSTKNISLQKPTLITLTIMTQFASNLI